MFPALASRLLTTEPPEKPPHLLKKSNRLHFLEQFWVYRKTDWKVQRVPSPPLLLFSLLLISCISVIYWSQLTNKYCTLLLTTLY